jgi:hypothetical protein
MTSKSRFVGPGSTVKNTLFLIILLGIGVALYFRLRYLLSPPAPKSTQNPNQSVSSSPGEILITFTKRSPLSGPRDLARRLGLSRADVEPDYDLSARPFRAYVPKPDPKQPYGIFVYLNYKDSTGIPSSWMETLDKTHTLFITPVCHHGIDPRFSGSVPLWQTLGLAFDAVENLKQKYAIDPQRMYLMTFNDGGMRAALTCSDVFSGMVVCYDLSYFEPVYVPDREGFYTASFPEPPDKLLKMAMGKPLILIADDFRTRNKHPRLLVEQMRAEGFEHILPIELSLNTDVHYPDFASKWFSETALPFLDRRQVKMP